MNKKYNFSFIAENHDCFQDIYKSINVDRAVLCLVFALDLSKKDCLAFTSSIVQEIALGSSHVSLFDNEAHGYEAEIHGMDEADVDVCVTAFEKAIKLRDINNLIEQGELDKAKDLEKDYLEAL